ncbi:MAG: hypothetical protein DMG38_17455 [Acidobacteria bacterium]|nr:MAG: hypothetical protein DMG38_17455 [Acidobacteriota bacterium]
MRRGRSRTRAALGAGADEVAASEAGLEAEGVDFCGAANRWAKPLRIAQAANKNWHRAAMGGL